MASEVLSELRAVVLGRASIVDGIIPPLVFGIGNALVNTEVAAILAVSSALMTIAVRLQKGRSLKFALAGLFGVVVAAAFAIWLGPERFFIPSIISGVAMMLLILISIIAKRPFVAFTSWLARDWALDWCWHPQVRPA
jgi:urea transporter